MNAMTDLIRGLYNIAPRHQGGVLTIGNFDGVHLGHQALIKKIKEKAAILNASAIVLTFEPQPLEFFANKPVARLTRWREKFYALRQTNVDAVCVLRFNQALANLSANDFIKKILVDHLKIRHIIVGDDFRFGYQRQGDFEFLVRQGKQLGFTVENMPDLMIHNERVSSTRIRMALNQDHLILAEQLLGRPYCMMGRVVHGDKLGRQLGFPTANIFLHRALAPIQGIYAVQMTGIGNQALPGVANVGIRPTIGGTKCLLEVYLFDFDRDIYGQSVSVEFCKKIRSEEYFSNLDLLKAAIHQDVIAARNYFEKRGVVKHE